LFHLTNEEFGKVLIAYEPVWAIGTGVTASNEEAQEMHAFIRATVEGKYGKEIADAVIILYGGSVNASNSAELFACPDVDVLRVSVCAGVLSLVDPVDMCCCLCTPCIAMGSGVLFTGFFIRCKA
jgi:triosephosphate isomerase